MNDRDKLREEVALKLAELCKAMEPLGGPTFGHYADAILPIIERKTAAATPTMQGEPVAWMYGPSPSDAAKGAPPVIRIYRDPHSIYPGWTETPLYAHPAPPMPADVVGLQGQLRVLQQSHDWTYYEKKRLENALKDMISRANAHLSYPIQQKEVGELPDGLYWIEGKPTFACRVCDAWTVWDGEPEDFEDGHPNNVCGGSPRCCP